MRRQPNQEIQKKRRVTRRVTRWGARQQRLRWLITGLGLLALAIIPGHHGGEALAGAGGNKGGSKGGSSSGGATFNQNPSPATVQGPIPLVSFGAGSLIIPMDGCYQRPSNMKLSEIELIMGNDATDDVCNGNNEKDAGLIPAYTLMFKLVKAGITVHWVIKDGKSGWHDVDLSISRAGGAPVTHANVGASSWDNRYSGLTQINYRGAPFVIAADQAAAAWTLMDSLKNTCEQGTCYTAVDVHKSTVDFDAPVYSSMDKLPRLAVVNIDSPSIGVHQPQVNKLEGSIAEAMMNDMEGILFDWVTTTDVVDGKLISGGYDLAWIPPFDLTSSATSAQLDVFNALSAFADSGGSVLFQDGAVAAMEGDVAGQNSVINFQIDGKLDAAGPASTWDNCAANENTRSEDYSDPASQFGGICWTGVGGSKYEWKTVSPKTFFAGSRRQVITDSSNSADDDWTLASWRYKDNDTSKGRIFYLGGFHWRKNTASGFRLLLNTVLVTDAKNTPSGDITEVSRSAPIISTVDSVETHFQGSFETTFPAAVAASFSGNPSDDTWEFPHVVGHLRAVDASDIPETQTALSEVQAIFDGADGIPAVSTGGCASWFTTSCRTVFTHLAGGKNPDKVYLTTNTAESLGPYLGSSYNKPTLQRLVERILAGKKSGSTWVPALGGIDRSTPAVIEESVRLGVSRPTMIYVGGLDGMMHAFCAETVGGCVKGKELWAFIPRQQLGRLASNAGRVDGSPTVADVFGDFDGDGNKELRTVLTFQTGSGDATSTTMKPAVYALDVTDPTAPEILWEVTTPDQRGEYELGLGTNTAMAPIFHNGASTPVTFVQSNNGGTAGAGFVAYALSSVDGEVVWSFTHAYPSARLSGNSTVPTSAIPGGATVFSSNARPTADTLLLPSIYGDLWVLNPSTGQSKYNGPLFRFTTDFHPVGAPVSVYRDRATGNWRAVIVSGGYSDSNPVTWSPSDVEQFGVAVDIVVPAAVTPLSMAAVTDGERGWTVSLGVGRRAFAQPVIAGDELFVVTDSEDVNLDTFGSLANSGRLQRFSLSTQQQLGISTLAGGGGSIDVSTTSQSAHVAGGANVQRDVLTGFNATGASAELPFEEQGLRMLWLRAE